MLNEVISLVLRAGALIAAEAARPGGPRGAGDKADIDVEVEILLREGLLRLQLGDFWGEETGSALTGASHCWVVDPNDGTTDFLAGRPGSAISVGLLKDAVPVLGVVYAPVTTRGPDCIAWELSMTGLLRNGRHICPNLDAWQLDANSVVFVSTAADQQPELNTVLCAPARFSQMPSIAGVSLYPVSPHDVVAGHALLKAAGGDLLDQDGHPIRYDDLSKPLCRSCFGGNLAASQSLAARPWRQRLSIPS
ncbi:Myo-inositol-1(Or 4)-monophosphatase [Pseudomonas sp. OF001]|uniref:inositol monophosphatase family protein n=1 Tax=unclassified Pseudomonas TaxID=196821 RepID=UPI0019185D50|nr:MULTISPECIES: inositol monophosphatase family protein [unclassified Pseudomonas]WPP46076.1 inositol monophosphatase family protein [Pseudomonas sp. AN-1]CAD5379117.1 Myo-inositol-1(Or 4)-monophosphatase [Pseudomonas sp. OF001]